jgi:uncharacterized protein YcbK (DUF882 family)
MDWSQYPNFSESEFKCKETGKCRMRKGFMDRLQRLRTEYGKPMSISSGYRDRSHSSERNKPVPGTHTLGCACDVRVSRGDAYRLIELAMKHGFTGIGVSQKGSKRFVHLDDFGGGRLQPRPTIWSY